MRPLALAISLAAVLAAGSIGCADGEDELEVGSLRDCLAGEGLKFEPTVTGGAVLGSASPDFRLVTAEGDGVDVIVEGNEQKASRTAADIRGSLQAFGAPESVVLVDRNAVIVLEGEPSADLRQRVEGCLER